MFLQNKLLNNKDNIKFLNNSWEKLIFAIKVFGELLLWLGSCCGPLMVLTLGTIHKLRRQDFTNF